MDKTALLAAYEKNAELEQFALGLTTLGYDLLGSAGTARFLNEKGITIRDVADVVGEPILGHRVVTLDRRIYAALLARYGNEEDLAELERLGVPLIDLVFVTLYPLGDELANPELTFDSVIEKTDIGGPTLLRAAAKGGRIVVSSPAQFDRVLEVLGSSRDANPWREAGFMRQFLSGLAAEAEQCVAEYAALSARFHRTVADGDFPHYWRRRAAERPS